MRIRHLLASCALGSAMALPLSPARSQAKASGPKPAGQWISLFDGKTLDGWTRRNGSAEYKVVDGVIIGTTSKGSPNSFLCTKRYYGDFELEFETKLFDDDLNSGCQIRSQSLPIYNKGRVHGPQVEISTNGNAGWIYEEAARGWRGELRENPLARAAFKKGEWNHYRVLAVGPVIRTWINGVPIADYRDDRFQRGFIGLQVHAVRGDPKWRVGWRQIRLRELGDGGGWLPLFDGRSLEGWTVSENPGSVRVDKGAIVVNGPRAHAFYTGPIHHHSWKNFEFKCLVWTEPKANSGVYFHTEFQKGGWPEKGYEVQVNNSQHDWRRTGGLYAVADLKEAPAKDQCWFELRFRVVGKHVQVFVDGKLLVDYTEPDNVKREPGFKGRLLGRGTFALQAHDPGSLVRYKNLQVRPLPYWR
ncbi:MAG: hypothetical protein CSA62_04935 [Planctomycetota bacterium]|nr:MAG: hypothetical protein CSA62_04935 [Planctomycetota bacterium]